MTLTAFIAGIFAIAEAIPILRDALWDAISLYYMKKIEMAKVHRNEAIEELKKAETPEQYQAALGNIVRNRGK